jgi:hypothetical protein
MLRRLLELVPCSAGITSCSFRIRLELHTFGCVRPGTEAIYRGRPVAPRQSFATLRGKRLERFDEPIAEPAKANVSEVDDRRATLPLRLDEEVGRP